MGGLSKLKINFIPEKETKGTIRFKEVGNTYDSTGEMPIIGTIYVKKWAAIQNNLKEGFCLEITKKEG